MVLRLPRFVQAYATDRGLTNTIPFGQVYLQVVRRTYFLNLIPGQLGITVTLPPSLPPPIHLVLHVVCVSPCRQVLRIQARRIITRVTNLMAFGYGSHPKLVSEPMNRDMRPVIAELSVPVFIPRPVPLPAAGFSDGPAMKVETVFGDHVTGSSVHMIGVAVLLPTLIVLTTPTPGPHLTTTLRYISNNRRAHAVNKGS
jgi:hypothetical protein